MARERACNVRWGRPRTKRQIKTITQYLGIILDQLADVHVPRSLGGDLLTSVYFGKELRPPYVASVATVAGVP